MRNGFACLSLLVISALTSRLDADHIFFVENLQDEPFAAASWGFWSGASSVQLANDYGEGTGNFPVNTEQSFKARDSLLLKWTSNPGGDWGVAIAGANWVAGDLGGSKSLTFSLNAPAGIQREALPDVALEDTGNRKSSRAWMGDYIAGVDGDSNSWQQVTIPIGAFQPGVNGANLRDIKTVYFLQRLPDGAEHELWIDNVRAVIPGSTAPVPVTPGGLEAKGHHLRVDLRWTPAGDEGEVFYNVYRGDSAEGPFERINEERCAVHLYSDFAGTNGATYYYRVTALNAEFDESEPSEVKSAMTREMTDDELLTSVQEAVFRYFYDFGHPVSGLIRESSRSGDVCAIGGTGFGLMNIMIGVERGFITREQGVERLLKMVRFLQDKTERYHGAYPHQVYGNSGKTHPFSDKDDGADIVETAYLAQGLLTIRQYFDGDGPEEQELRRRATEIWEGVEWDWFRKTPDGDVLLWHWSPRYEWEMNHVVRGFNECMITYLMAIASPSHPIPASLFNDGWANDYWYENGNTYYGHKVWVGPDHGGNLFFTHYSFLGFDPRNKRDKFCNYFENNRNITLVHRDYAIANPNKWKGYGTNLWGFTASLDPSGYSGHSPTEDNGTITPTAAISAMPYTPAESMAALRHMYEQYGKKIWGPFGFIDAFNLQVDWYADAVLAIDQGTIAPMIENRRTGLCWKMFMSNPEVQAMVKAIGFTEDPFPPADFYTAE